jgi:beta-glucosidase
MQNRTYRYFTGEALYPFGFGMSYTEFAYSDAFYQNGKVTVTVENKGTYDADEVVQVYIKDLDSPFAVKNHSLCAFLRVGLDAGEKTTVTLPVNAKAFRAIGEDGEPTSLGKRFTLYVGGSQPDARSVALTQQKPLEIDVEI